MTRGLIDTHVLIWAATTPVKLSRRVAKLLMNPSFEVIVSTAVVWEIVLKVQSGKLKIPNPVSWIEDELGRLNATILPIKLNHALEAHRSPLRHRDPFDRMLFAQATIEKCPLLTSDPLILGQGQTIAIW